MEKRLFLSMVIILFLISCENLPADKNSQIISNINSNKKIEESICSFSNPDTSLANIKLRNPESVISILGKRTKLKGDSTYIFYSDNKTQKLEMIVHPGDFYNQVSIFRISFSDNSKEIFRQINTKEFTTEKGIKLGISKNEIIENFGTNYQVKDSTENKIVMNYKIELPCDSKTKLLARNNISIYYAIYRLRDNKLIDFEFGFEYP